MNITSSAIPNSVGVSCSHHDEEDSISSGYGQSRGILGRSHSAHHHNPPKLNMASSGEHHPAGKTGTTEKSGKSGKSLEDTLSEALPSTFKCNIRYLHSPPKPCEPLFSALPGSRPDKTRLASHLLTVSVDAASLQTPGTGHVIAFAVEVLLFTTRRLTTIFVSKVDSTSYVPRIRPSPIKTTVTTFLKWLADKERRKRPGRQLVISLFARAQSQYLFPGSSEDAGKHVLDDRQLIKWWARVLDPIIPATTAESDGDVQYQGYLTVPGYEDAELRSFMPPSSSPSTEQPRWLPGHPLVEIGRTRGVPEHAPPRCLLPRFPDDPKARFISDLDDEIGISQDSHVTASPSKVKSARWRSVTSLEQFWEQMEFRQECCSGRAVGFLWLVISPKRKGDDVLGSDDIDTNVDGQESLRAPPTSGDPALSSGPNERAPALGGSPKKRNRKRKRRPLTGVIVSRMPKIKSTQSSLLDMKAQHDALSGDGILVDADGYDKAMSTMLRLDFSNLEAAIWSTTRFIADVAGIAGLSGDFATEVTGAASVETVAISAAVSNGSSSVNDMSGLIRKKRKVEDSEQQPTVNVLSSGMVRKKPKPPAT
jgi:regulator of Ty1 transposition protein 109